MTKIQWQGLTFSTDSTRVPELHVLVNGLMIVSSLACAFP